MVQIGLKIDKAKTLFFDRKMVEKRVKDADRRNLSRAGAFIRRDARGSMKKAPKLRKNKKGKFVLRKRKAGTPPNYITRLLKDHLFFIYDPRKNSVIVGPARINTPKQNDFGKSVPALLEVGGVYGVDRFDKKTGTVRLVKRNMNKHPYMGPAYEKNESKIVQLWKNSY